MWAPIGLVTKAMLLPSLVSQYLLTPFHGVFTTSSTTSTTPNNRAVPGGSGVTYCAESQRTDLFSIERLQVYPTPPYLEEYVDIHIYGMWQKDWHRSTAKEPGTFLKNITANATLDYRIDINHGYAVTEGQMQFCDIDQGIEQPDPDREVMCPPEKGFALISLRAFMFQFFAAANYTLRYDAITAEGERIYCLEADFYLGCRNGYEPDCRKPRPPPDLTLQSGST